MKKTFPKFLFIYAVFLCGFRTTAQSFSIDWFNLDGGAISTGGGYDLTSTIGQTDGSTMNGSGYTLDTGFGSIITDGGGSVTIFQNTDGSFNGVEAATTNSWLANKFCTRQTTYSLDSVTLLMTSQDYSGTPSPSTVRLQLFASDPVSDRPSTNLGVIMTLAESTNPITLPLGNVEAPVKWIPTESFTLAANTCYWAVLSIDGGAAVWQTATFSMPTGDAGTFGRVSSFDAGANWGSVDPLSNRKMLITGIPMPVLLITAIEKVSNDLRLSFSSVSGKTYAIQTSSDLSPSDWVTLPIPPNPGTGGILQVTITNALTPPRQFYRVKQLP